MEYTSWITYFYVVDGQPFRGRAASVNSKTIGWSQFDENAYAALKRYPAGGTFGIYVNRNNPSDSIFLEEYSAMTSILFPLVAAAFLILVVALRLRRGRIADVFLVVFLFALSLTLIVGFRLVPEPSEPIDRTVAGIELFQSNVVKKRAAWDVLTPDSTDLSLDGLGPPDEVFIAEDGTETWIFKMGPGMEMEGEVVLRPSDKGLSVQRVVRPFMTKTSAVQDSWSAQE